MPFSTYSELSTALGTWGKRTYSGAQTDEFIALSEANANRRLKADFRRRTTTTLTTSASGLVTLPSGFVGVSSVTRDVLGSVPLKQVPWAAAIERNPYELSEEPAVFAINGTSLQVSPIAQDVFNVAFSQTVSALSSSNQTNWLLTLAPDFYLFMGRAMASAYHEAWQTAQGLKSDALAILDELVAQGNVAELGSAEMTLPMVTP